MDFHSLNRRELQALCKKNKIPANSTSAAMADALEALQFVEGLEDFTRLPQQSPEKIALGLSDAPQTAFGTSAPTKPIKEQLESVQPGTRTRTRTRGRSRKAGEDTVQKTQGTRRSTRLMKKAGSSLSERGKTEALKIDDFSKETETDPEEPSVQNPEESDDLDELPKRWTGPDTSLENEGDSQDLDEGREKEPSVQNPEESDGLDELPKKGTGPDTSLENEGDSQDLVEGREKLEDDERDVCLIVACIAGQATMEGSEKPPAVDLELNENQENEAVKIDDFCEEIGTYPEEPLVHYPEESDDLDSTKIGTVLDASVENEDGTGQATMEGSDKPPAVDREKLMDNEDGTGQATMESSKKPPAVDLEINELQENKAVKIDDFCEEMGTNPEEPSVQNPEESDDLDSKKIGTVLDTSVENEDGTGHATMEDSDKPPAEDRGKLMDNEDGVDQDTSLVNEGDSDVLDKDREKLMDNEDGTGQATMEGSDKPPAVDREKLMGNEDGTGQATMEGSDKPPENLMEKGDGVDDTDEVSEKSDVADLEVNELSENEGNSKGLEEDRGKFTTNEDSFGQTAMEEVSETSHVVDLELNELPKNEAGCKDSEEDGETVMEDKIGVGQTTMEEGLEISHLPDLSAVSDAPNNEAHYNKEEVNQETDYHKTAEKAVKAETPEKTVPGDDHCNMGEESEVASQNIHGSRLIVADHLDQVLKSHLASDGVAPDNSNESSDTNFIIENESNSKKITISDEPLEVVQVDDLKASCGEPTKESHFASDGVSHEDSESSDMNLIREMIFEDHVFCANDAEAVQQDLEASIDQTYRDEDDTHKISGEPCALVSVEDESNSHKDTREHHGESSENEPSSENFLAVKSETPLEPVQKSLKISSPFKSASNLSCREGLLSEEQSSLHKVAVLDKSDTPLDHADEKFDVLTAITASGYEPMFEVANPIPSSKIVKGPQFSSLAAGSHPDPKKSATTHVRKPLPSKTPTRAHMTHPNQTLKMSASTPTRAHPDQTLNMSASKTPSRAPMTHPDQTLKMSASKTPTSLQRMIPVLDKNMDEEKIDVLTAITANGYDLMFEVSNPIPSSQIMDGAQFSSLAAGSHPDQTHKKSATKTPMSFPRIPVLDKNMEKTHGRKPLPSKTPTRAPMIRPDQTLKMSATKTPTSLQRTIPVLDKNTEKTHGRKPLLRTPIRAPMAHPDQTLKMSATKAPTSSQRTPMTHDNTVRIAAHVPNNSNKENICKGSTDVKVKKNLNDMSRELKKSLTDTSSGDMDVKVTTGLKDMNICKGGTDVKVRKNLNDMSIRELKKMIRTKDQAVRAKMASPVENEAANEN